MIRKTLTILSLIGLLLSVGLGWRSCYGPIGYLDASGNSLYVLNNIVRFGGTRDQIHFSMNIPMGFFAMSFVFLILPFHRRRKRKKLGLCVKCGYDLRASKDRCPECGALIEK